mmetsp:Transcript_933/g.2231  ORF Transcript_933/g.2231 Transcript_933/m.2231 type:complete len:246 (+) Transcript_933:412-1149(+)
MPVHSCPVSSNVIFPPSWTRAQILLLSPENLNDQPSKPSTSYCFTLSKHPKNVTMESSVISMSPFIKLPPCTFIVPPLATSTPPSMTAEWTVTTAWTISIARPWIEPVPPIRVAPLIWTLVLPWTRRATPPWPPPLSAFESPSPPAIRILESSHMAGRNGRASRGVQMARQAPQVFVWQMVPGLHAFSRFEHGSAEQEAKPVHSPVKGSTHPCGSQRFFGETAGSSHAPLLEMLIPSACASHSLA